MAGFFGFFDYTKPGKGVRKDEPKRSHFSMFWVLFQRKFGQMVQLNLLFILFCLPVVTIGPAIAGMTYVLRNFANQRPVFLVSDFWDAFKNNFKQSFVYSILCALAGYLLFVSGWFYFQNAPGNMWMYAPFGLVLFISLLYIFMNFYIFLMIVTLDLPLKSIIKNGIFLAVLCLKSNLITLFWLAVIVIGLIIYPVIGALVYIFIGFSLLGFITVHNAYQGIQVYAIDPYIRQLQGDDADDDDDEEDLVFSDNEDE
jgi:uncharacterized membrane protein YesL